MMALSKQQWQSDIDLRPKYQVQVSDTGEESVSITQVVHTIRLDGCRTNLEMATNRCR